MRFIDCFMYFDEDMILDMRLNILDKYVSNFIICEANFNHNGTNRKLKFDINKFSKFKEKIIYIPLEEQPKNLRKILNSDNQSIKNSKILDNALLRENFQRNFLKNKIKNFHDDDLIIISDVDEIPNLENFTYKAKITFFEQKMFYYKLNLLHKNFKWYGSKITKKKHLKSPQWLRNIKSRKYPFWRIDILFSMKKYHNINFVKNGGWHFTNIKTPEEIDKKLRSYMHHPEYDQSNIGPKEIDKMIKERKPVYDLMANSSEVKDRSNTKLKVIDVNELPLFIRQNQDKYNEWIL